MYGRRIERERLLLQLELKYWDETLRYVANMQFSGRLSEKEMIATLAEAKYQTISSSALFHSAFTPTVEIEARVYAGNYNYLLDLSDRNKSQEAVAKYQGSRASAQARLARLEEAEAASTFPGSTTWLAELDELEAIVKEGRRTNWAFDDCIEYTFD
jgi:hypothetical protein